MLFLMPNYLTEIEAYPCGRNYVARMHTKYHVGQFVTVGPRYSSESTGYRYDGMEGTYLVDDIMRSGRDYVLIGERGEEVIIHATRLTAAKEGI